MSACVLVCVIHQTKVWFPVSSRLPQLTPLPSQINTIDFPLRGVQHMRAAHTQCSCSEGSQNVVDLWGSVYRLL